MKKMKKYNCEDLEENFFMTGYNLLKKKKHLHTETLNLLTDADSRTDTILEKLHACFFVERVCDFSQLFSYFFGSLFLLLSPQLEAAPAPTSPPSPCSPPHKMNF